MFGSAGIALVFLMFVMPGGYGVPVGISPGVEDVYLHQVASEDCLMYASWSGVAELDPEGSPTEAYFAQEQIQKLISKLRRLDSGNVEVDGTDSEKAYSRLVTKLPGLALTNPCCFYVDEVRWMPDRLEPELSGAFLLGLGEEAEEIKKLVAAIGEVPRPEQGMGGQSLLGIFGGYLWSVAGKRSVQIHEDYLVVSFAGDDMELKPQQFLEYAKRGEPQWLLDLKTELPIARRASLSMININEVNRVLFDDNNSEIDVALELLGTKDIKFVGWVTGLDDEGYVCRTTIHCDLNSKGLVNLFNLPPLEKEKLTGIHQDRDFVLASRLSTDRLYQMIENVASRVGERDGFNSMIAEFEAFSGVSLKDDLVAELDEYFYIYGDFELADAQSKWLLALGIRDENEFFRDSGKPQSAH